MAGLDKRVASYEAALEGLTDGMTLLAGGFGLCGIPENLIAEVQRRRAGADGGLQQLRGRRFRSRHAAGVAPVSKVVASYVGENALFEQLVLSGELAVELTRRERWRKNPRRRRRHPRLLHRHRVWHPGRRRQRGAPVRRPTLHP